ncbi:hypothetical protein [Sorangium sp. So ce362]|uniref:hypothetical protein n=1 Tax=Sorangium sp. So ce362 TaxID=3133303 RepID=UPI003F5F4BA4
MKFIPKTAVHSMVDVHLKSQQSGLAAQMLAMHGSPHVAVMWVATPGAYWQASCPQSAGMVVWVQQFGFASQTFATQPLQVDRSERPVSHGLWAHAPCAGCSQYWSNWQSSLVVQGWCVPCRATPSGSSLMSPTDHVYVVPTPERSMGPPSGTSSNDWHDGSHGFVAQRPASEASELASGRGYPLSPLPRGEGPSGDLRIVIVPSQLP